MASCRWLSCNESRLKVMEAIESQEETRRYSR